MAGERRHRTVTVSKGRVEVEITFASSICRLQKDMMEKEEGGVSGRKINAVKDKLAIVNARQLVESSVHE